jgi:hypothetical protein
MSGILPSLENPRGGVFDPEIAKAFNPLYDEK